MKPFLLAFLFAFVFAKTKAQPGTLDSTFGTNGRISLGTDFTATAFQQDGKLVGLSISSGKFTLSRFDNKGAPDASFGNGGTKTVDFGSSNDYAVRVAVGADNKIVVFASRTLWRFNNNGTPDAAFGNGGVVMEERTMAFTAQLAIKNDGKIVVAEYVQLPQQNNSLQSGIRVNGYNVDGSRDFSTIITITSTPEVYYYFQGTDLLIQKDGKIVLGAYNVENTSQGFTFYSLVSRLNSDGSIDLTYGNAGIARTVVADNANVVLIAEDNEGKIIVYNNLGGYDNRSNSNLIKRNTNGTVDVEFGTVSVPFDAGKIGTQEDGKIIVAGSRRGPFTLARYNRNGTMDTTFGNGGIVTSDFGERGIVDLFISTDRIYAYGGGIEAVYLLNEPELVGPESNTLSGNHALSSNTTGTANTAYGANALQANTSGSGNTGIGYNSMYSNGTGVNNTATGGAALGLNTSGSNNAAFGVGAGFNNNNFSSTFIGTLADATLPVTNSTALGYQATVNASNQVRIGNSAVTSIGGFTNWTNLSDGRLKKNVNEDVPGLAFITQLRPVTYNLDIDDLDTKLRTNIASRQSTTKALSILPPSAVELEAKVEKAKEKFTGFVAQEVEQAAKKLGYDFSGVDIPKDKDGMYGLRYAEFVVPLVKAVQEQQKQIQELKELVAKLSSGATNNNTTVQVSSAYLEQNYPNPNNSSALVRYHIPAAGTNAKIVITNMKGQVIKSIDLNSRGDGQITLDAATLAAGTYNYSLWIGGKEVDSKRMVVVR